MKKSPPSPPDFLVRVERPFLQPKFGSKKGPFLAKKGKKPPNYLKLIKKVLAWKMLLKK